FTLYRNFYDAYAREWQNGNSRWDIIDMARLTRALRPEGINWPDHDDGKPSFRLEALTAANNIEHAGAHDALVDVYATIAFAKLIKTAQPKLYDFIYQHRGKNAISPLMNIHERTPFIHTSRMYPSEYCGTALVVPIAKDPTNNNGIIVYDLRHDPSDLINEDADTLRERLYSKTADLAEKGLSRPALKTLHINKCPIVVPENTLNDEAAKRLDIDREQHYKHLAMLNDAGDLTQKLNAIFKAREFDAVDDPDASLYGGGFFSGNDKRKMDLVREAGAEQLKLLSLPFDDARLEEMLFRYRARNWSESLSAEEQAQWQQYRQERLNGDNEKILSFDRFFNDIQTCRSEELTDKQRQVLDKLEAYGQQLQAEVS
ncbi:MAG: exodeoxyribonuclease I, partial [Proteobacteria bacterium]|nr:exodeoxyribonuclease I [Pseudomonadota bacterium]